MNSEKNEEKILENNNNSLRDNDTENNTSKKEEKISKAKAVIEMQKEGKNKKRKKIKIRAYCNKCYQFFENGPYTKICRNHLEKECNLIECQKYRQNGDNPCIRKFPNINSANRHTHCLTKKDIEIWDPKCEIQKCLGKKKESDNKFSDIINNVDNNNEKGDNKSEKKLGKNNISNNSFFNDVNNNSLLNLNLNMNNNLFLDNNNSFLDNNNSNYFSNNNNVIGLIEDIEKFHFNENDNNNNNVDLGLIEDIEKIHFHESDRKNSNNETNQIGDKCDENGEIKNILEKDDLGDNKNKDINNKTNNIEINNNNINNNEINSNKTKNNDKDEDKEKDKERDKEKNISIENIQNESIEDFFEKVQKETNIPNNIKKKLVKAFKKKGIFNVKILILFYKKHKNWDFLIEEFKKITSQIEGVALCIEFLLKIH